MGKDLGAGQAYTGAAATVMLYSLPGLFVLLFSHLFVNTY